MNARAVVFAYHNVGARCLRVLLARGVDVALVVTHEDSPHERIWFESVAAVATDYGLPMITPADPRAPDLADTVRAAQPDFIFSFYYRHMLPAGLLALAPRGAYNLHGSLLPRYRGRVPTNWAVLNGETETGATLHEMTAKPDAGAIIAQTPVPILPDDTASQVFDKQVYNLVRAVAPPYPGAFTDIGGERFIVAAARLTPRSACGTAKLPPGLQVCDNALFGVCGDARALAIRELCRVERDAAGLAHGERVIDAATFVRLTQSSSHS
ncbi:hypothetical protein DFQ30_001290 [Apophysomyces sp. BC1015]|nr:hypothetical protein DFQ30_001290 [Apophysomyces sp. BC1015]